ncbi:MAG TPA: ATP-dependent DNA helicase [Clostridiaceae bacterium]|nr:ATP-dependent DNA helicase [Clostridiaceae bacterium]
MSKRLNNKEISSNQEEALHFKTSVRNLVAFSVKDDALWSFSSYRLANEGSLAHSQLQAINKAKGNYASEVHLSYTFEIMNCILEVNGRSDGIWRLKDKIIVQEIKTSAAPLSEIHENFSEAHWAQGKCYAYLISLLEDIDEVTVRLTYYDREKNEEKSFDKCYSRNKLQRFFKTLVYPYLTWAISQEKWKEIRNLSIKDIIFPYPSYRKGQKLLAYNTYKCMEDNKRLFVQAPTGIGKTMGVLYPAIKALGEGKVDRLFYATAKTTTRGIAETAYNILAEQGLRLKVLTLTAKEKICLNDEKDCNPDKCPFILGYMSRCRKVVKELLKKHDFFPREIIAQAGLRHGICPFELSLDLALSCDLIICDYNYIFDPRVYLRRFFEQKGRENYLIMIDEAHNLFDRARGMYSAELNVRLLLDISKEIKKDLPVITKALLKLRKELAALENQAGEPAFEAGGVKYNMDCNAPYSLKAPLGEFITATEGWIAGEKEDEPYTDKLVNVFFEILHFKNILEIYSDNYRTLMTGKKTRFCLKLVCLDPSTMLDSKMCSAKSAVLFSATLSPLWYFKSILGGRGEDITLRLPSPFPRKNLLVLNEDCIETRYSHREQYLESTARAIYDWSVSHKGNIMVFFPSYKYLLDVLEFFKALAPDFDILCQNREMDEPAREDFLRKFNDFGDKNRIAFCVLGGVFGEGIDLTGEKLTGVIIVGVGLPQVSPELEIMRNYYQNKGVSGFAFAYTYPGINKVLQAAGRLIRSENDRGALLLIDSRFAASEYLSLLPEEWHPIPKTSQGTSAYGVASGFWNKNKEA